MPTDIGVEKIHWAFATKRHHWLSQPLAGLVFATKHLAGREEHPRNTQTFLGLIGRKNPRLALAEGLGIDVELAGQSLLAKAECSGNLANAFAEMPFESFPPAAGVAWQPSLPDGRERTSDAARLALP